MELKYIEAFLAVVEKGSFSTAAEALFITQPTISVRIQLLEQELNTILFNRTSGKKVFLTPSGEKVFPLFKEAYNLIQTSYSILKETSVKQNKITISCPNHMGVEIMPELLKGLYQAFSEIEFSIEINVTKEIIQDIRDGKVDVGFAYSESPNMLKDLTVVQIAKERSILVSAPDHPLTQAGMIQVTDLKDERIVTYSKAFLNTNSVERYLQKQGLKNYKTVEINNLGWIKMMVRKGLGIAFLQKMIVNDELKNQSLVELPLSKPIPSTPIFLIFRPDIRDDVRDAVIQITQKLFEDL